MDKVTPEVVDILDSKSVSWTSIDVVRIGYEEEETLPLVLWIGITPLSLSSEDGIKVAVLCKNVLQKHAITSVECEIREAKLIPHVQLQLMKPIPSAYKAIDLQLHLTDTIGIVALTSHRLSVSARNPMAS